MINIFLVLSHLLSPLKQQPRKGFVLIMSILMLTSLLVSGTYLISVANSENKISQAVLVASKNYYLAETGINEMMWKIQNDTATKNAFIAGTLDEDSSITRNNVFGDSNASYQVSARNTVPAEAWIIATSSFNINNAISQRVIKTYISQPHGTTPWTYSSFSGGQGTQENGNMVFTGSGKVFKITGGNLHSNQIFKIQGCEIEAVNAALTSSNRIDVIGGGQLTLTNSTTQYPVSMKNMLQIDFDSVSPNSWKNRATLKFSEAQFNALPNNTLLAGIIYVDGNANITNKNFYLIGVLVASGNINIDNTNKNFILAAGTYVGGGLLAKNNLGISTNNGSFNATGMLYSAKSFSIYNNNTNFNINGSITAYDVGISGIGTTIDLVFNPNSYVNVIDPINNPVGPVIQISHWEEQY
jgi:hypothetical protein